MRKKSGGTGPGLRQSQRTDNRADNLADNLAYNLADNPTAVLRSV